MNPLRSQTLIGIATPFAPANANEPPGTEPAPTIAQSEAAPTTAQSDSASTTAQSDSAPADVAVAPSAPEPEVSGSPVAVGPSTATPDAAFARPATPVASKPASSPATTESAPASSASKTPPAAGSRSGLGTLFMVAAGLAIAVGGYRFLHRDAGARDRAVSSAPAPELGAPAALTPPAISPTPSPAAADSAPALEPTPSAVAIDPPVAASPVTEPAPEATASAAVAAAEAPAAPAPSAAAEAPAASAQQVTITTKPPKGKFFHFGKEVGTSPFVVDLPPGEKRAYEVWLPGHITRKVLVDGSKSQLTIGLREEPAPQ